MGTEVRNRLIVLAVVLVLAVVFLLPSLQVIGSKISGATEKPTGLLQTNWVSKPISLGLDLSGGVHLVYRVKTEEAVKSRLQVTANGVRSELRAKKIPILKAKIDQRGDIAFTLLSERSLEKVKQFIAENRTDLEFRRQSTSGSRQVLTYGISENRASEIKRNAVEQAIETLRSRVDKFGVAEPLIQRQGIDRIVLQMPGVQDIEAVKAIVGKVAKLEFRFLPNAPTADSVNMPTRDGGDVAVEDVVQMSGDAVESASIGYDQTNRLEVLLRLNPDGAKLFGKVTGENVGRRMAIILDGVVYSSPEILERIPGGQCSITGGFSIEEAKQLAIVLRAGALPAPLEVLTERTVGPTLGQESIRKGLTAILVGFALVLLAMVLYYKKSGFVASGILLLNIILVMAALSAFGATLTLPGLAGLALTVGMAVDANVIIFERVREELNNGVHRDSAISIGFDRALGAIIDSNVTTLLAGLILYYFGTGPIRGFAVTLSIGLLTTIFCATFLARLAFDCFSLKGGKEGLSI